MACPFDQASDRHPTPPLSPSMSSGSSRESSAPFSTSSSSHLPRDIDGLHSSYPDSQPLGHSNPVIELGRMPDGLGDDTLMLDEWEGEGKRKERDDDTSLHSQPDPVSFPLHLESSTFSESVSFPRPSHSRQQTLLSQQFNPLPSTDVIDVAKLARQDQPPPAYENVDERPSSLTSRASRPLPRPPFDRLSSSSSTHSVGLVADAGSAGPHETTNLTSQSSSSAPICTDPVVSTSQPFPTPAGTFQPPAVSVGILRPLDPSSQDQLARSAGISPLSSQSPFSFPPRTPSEPSQQSAPSSSFNHDSLWTVNQTVSGAQQETSRLTASVSSRPISSPGGIQTLSPPPPCFPSEASQSRTGRHLSDSAADMRSIHRPRPALPAPSSRGLPPPAPPTILDPPPAHSNSICRSRAPYEPYLSDAPAPPDSWIAVETSPVEYRLVVRLPGFRRDAITLAARRRRVLHVVADSWEPGGGHFERRISFGYDADLGHVRAEFDGEILRIIVPRRIPALTWYGAACE